MGTFGAEPRVGVMGGSFDPVHYGHLRVASDVKRLLQLDTMTLMPAARSPLKTTKAVSSSDRVAMLKLALEEFPELGVDQRELEREGPSFTVDTLQQLRAELGPDTAIFFVIGDDLLPSLDRWSRWQQLTDFAHLVVTSRPGASAALSPEVAKWWRARELSLGQIAGQCSGTVSRLESALVDVSSTEIRRSIESGIPIEKVIPESVLEYISKHKLYLSSRQTEATL
ncbi:MAG TPA: nicotinic acid mononucleotide adenylyltransferase [Halieaceae bacterium]|nr:nicotinic acid mononucleotide adenylyltransferase [Halieaceae bacterium]